MDCCGSAPMKSTPLYPRCCRIGESLRSTSGIDILADAVKVTLGPTGRTAATLLAQSIVKEGPKAVAAGINPMDMKRGVDQGPVGPSAQLRPSRLPTTIRASQLSELDLGPRAVRCGRALPNLMIRSWI